jgi:hypothetical protein
VKVVGVVANLEKKDAYIIAGTTLKRSTGESRLMAVRVDGKTAFSRLQARTLTWRLWRDCEKGMGLRLKGRRVSEG